MKLEGIINDWKPEHGVLLRATVAQLAKFRHLARMPSTVLALGDNWAYVGEYGFSGSDVFTHGRHVQLEALKPNAPMREIMHQMESYIPPEGAVLLLVSENRRGEVAPITKRDIYGNFSMEWDQKHLYVVTNIPSVELSFDERTNYRGKLWIN